MTTRRSFLRRGATAAVAVAMLWAVPLPARADAIDDLQKKFEARYRDLRRLKDAGTVGETAAGFVEPVKGGLEGADERLISQENDDRRELYALIAKRQKTTADVVAKQNAIRNFRKAKSGDWLKGESGKWAQKP